MKIPFCQRKMKTICCYCLAGFLLIELLLFNIIAVYLYSFARNVVGQFQETNGGFLDKLMSNNFGKEVMYQMKENNHLIALLEGTVNRVYLQQISNKKENLTQNGLPQIFRLGVDVSNAGESLFIYERIVAQTNFHYKKLFIDIGANDGLISSNSFNFIQWGWDAILVEPIMSQVALAKRNLKRYMFDDAKQRVVFVEAVIASTDGNVKFMIDHKLGQMESHIAGADEEEDESKHMVRVKSYTVETFANKYSVPKYFAVLSIDAEGTGEKIITQWLVHGYRPAYIIYEFLHSKEHPGVIQNLFKEYGYQYLTMIGWNHIYECRLDRGKSGRHQGIIKSA